MDRAQFNKAKDIVLHYYESNEYSEERQKAIIRCIRTIDEILDKVGIQFDSNAIRIIIQFIPRGYAFECDIHHVNAMLLKAVGSGETDSRLIRHRSSSKPLLSVEFKTCLTDYISLLKRMGKAEQTVYFEEYANRNLLHYLESIGIHSFESITAGHLENFLMLRIPTFKKSTGQAIIYRLRHFFKYLVLEGKVDISLSLTLDIRIRIPVHVVTTLSEEQEKTLVDYWKPNTAIEARSRAVMLVCLRLGLRRSDVYKMKFSELDWKTETIHIIQQKTRKPLNLPIPKDVGYAIAYYVVNYRPKVESDYVFLSTRAPFGRKLNSQSDIVQAKRICRGESTWEGSYHILRRTCATRLLQKGTSLQVIMNILGQTTMDTLDCYLGLNVASMSMAPLITEELGLPEVFS